MYFIDIFIIDISELYTIENLHILDSSLLSKPFIYNIEIHNKTGEVVHIKVLIDNSAITNIISSEV